MTFPDIRMRRLRQSKAFRRMIRETNLSVDDLIYPLFVVHGSGIKKEIPVMPEIFHFSPDMLAEEISEIYKLGINAVMIFGVPKNKDAAASEAYADDGIVQQAIQAVKETDSGITVITDVCLCAYMEHGHCGVIRKNKVDNDLSLKYLARTAVSHARAGADMVSPSDMMDGRVQHLRRKLDSNNFQDTAIMSYAVKYASSFYNPFRGAVFSHPEAGDRRTYQMDPGNKREALREVNLDVGEGADIVMVKPALSYLDVIAATRESFDCPIAAYNVSGEYAMIKAAAEKGWLDEEQVILELLTSIKRAGADIILTYHAKKAAKLLQEGRG